MSTKTEFRKWAKAHPNVITPHIIAIRKVNNFFIEFSSGTGLNYKPMYGVTVYEFVNGKFDNNSEKVKDLSKPFFDKQTAIDYIDEIMEKLEV